MSFRFRGERVPALAIAPVREASEASVMLLEFEPFATQPLAMGVMLRPRCVALPQPLMLEPQFLDLPF